ncbi:class I SAM-dependent methyltransferase [Amycolatopsis suaedae]|uniref:Class I SAM-dependent methyltransferase n=1 Tax=Amycolatopsis suaedae TaxID=2510978 RepID=A0A4Q7IZN5_9PSEU|nr:class I SAM-dependent methyltransferase [Amycolatopsis suaedae]RZQ60521.1 class I SAM-dependent methyltransferase [Amycolatopsis suaedae]
MSDDGADAHTRKLAAADPVGWFERLYTEAEQGQAVVPWDVADPHRLLTEWARDRAPAGRGRALVVGCGFGRDAEFVAGLGFTTVAFDVSETAIRAARSRHPGSPVQYVAADLLAPPPGWPGSFDLVVESLTVQAMPVSLRPEATAAVGRLVAPGGTLLVIAAGTDTSPEDGPPWPLTRAEIDAFATERLRPVRVEALRDDELRWRAEFLAAG